MSFLVLAFIPQKSFLRECVKKMPLKTTLRCHRFPFLFLRVHLAAWNLYSKLMQCSQDHFALPRVRYTFLSFIPSSVLTHNTIHVMYLTGVLALDYYSHPGGYTGVDTELQQPLRKDECADMNDGHTYSYANSSAARDDADTTDTLIL